jgi:glycosyltransferase involved in cell wall biosynthesis
VDLMKNRVRVLHVIGGGEFGGAEQHILNLLTSLPKDEVEATVVCFYESTFAAKLREAGIPVVVLDQYGRFDFRLLGGLKRTIERFQPDIVHTHGVKANFFTRLAAGKSRALLITTVHSYLRYDYTNPLAYLLVSLMERGTRARNDHFIAVSQAIRQILQKEGVAADKISLIYNGIHIARFRRTEQRQSDRERLFAEWQLPPEAFVFGTVARFVPVKGLPLMIEAFAKLCSRDPARPYRLVLIGDGPERSALEQTAERYGVAKLVRFTGFRQDIPACLHAFDAFVMSSIHEGLPYTILEAVASEIPVAATAVGGIKEFIQSGETGLLVPSGSERELAEAMYSLANDSALRAKLVNASLAQLEQTFTIEKMAAKTYSLYQSLLHNLRETTGE